MGTISPDNGLGLGDKLKHAIDAGQDQLEAAKGRILDGKDKVRDGATRAYGGMNAMIREHPFMAVGVAFGIGYLAMRLVRR